MPSACSSNSFSAGGAPRITRPPRAATSGSIADELNDVAKASLRIEQYRLAHQIGSVPGRLWEVLPLIGKSRTAHRHSYSFQPCG